MKTCCVTLTFESVDKILWCDHSNETSLEVLLHGTICYSTFYKIKFGIFLEFRFLALLEIWNLYEFSSVALLGVKWLIQFDFYLTIPLLCSR